MLSLLFIIATFLSIVYGDPIISHNVPIPRDISSTDFVQSIVNYWTPERMANAEPKDVLIVDQTSLARLLRRYPLEAQPNDLEQSVLAMAPTINVTQVSSLQSRSTTPRISGKAFFVMNGRNYLCSGSVVSASNRDTVITAAHCVYDYELQMWASNWIFVPQYSNGAAPLGSWVARRITTLSNWANYRDMNSDVGIVLMHPNPQGQHIQQFTGGLGIKWNGNKQAHVYSFGYPKNMANGEMMSACAGLATSAMGVISGFKGVQMTCGMTNGASGGPWIQEYDASTMLGFQMSVNSFIIPDRPGNIFGPYFDSNIHYMYQLYANQ